VIPPRGKDIKMAYSDIDDAKKAIPETELIQLTDDADAGEIDEDVVAAAIADADSEIDSYAMVLYDVPFSPVPPVIRKLSTRIAIHNLFQRRQITNEAVDKGYDDAVKFLQRLADGKVKFAREDGTEAASAGAELEIKSQSRVFDRGKMEDF
jgi:phage gp36-like protein